MREVALVVQSIVSLCMQQRIMCPSSLPAAAIPDPQNDRGPFAVELQRTSLLPYSGPVQMKVEVFPEQGMFLVDLFYESRGRMQPLVRWQIDHLRGYGASNSVLKIETGRCASALLACVDCTL